MTSKKTKDKVGLNEQIAEHARMAKGWRHQSKADNAYALFEHINTSLFDGMLPQPVIGFDDAGRLKKAGNYSFEGDGIGLKHHFDLRKDLTQLELVIGLIHNSVHLKQETYEEKQTWYHTTEFRDAMAIFGLVCNDSGDVDTIILSKFEETLKMIGAGELTDELHTYEVSEATVVDDTPAVDESEVTITEGPKPTATVKAPKQNGNKGTSKMKKWSCACTNIRAATLVTASCTECGEDFTQEGNVTGKPQTKPTVNDKFGFGIGQMIYKCSVGCSVFATADLHIDGGCYKCGKDFELDMTSWAVKVN